LQIEEADIRLMDKAKQTLNFKNADGSSDPTRPNPFRVPTSNSLPPASGRDPSTGIASVEAIPKAYAEKLTKVDKVLVEVQIFGSTTGDVDIDFKPFVFPVAICRGCLTICADPNSTTDPYGMGCKDNGAQDGRICVDPTMGCAP